MWDGIAISIRHEVLVVDGQQVSARSALGWTGSVTHGPIGASIDNDRVRAIHLESTLRVDHGQARPPHEVAHRRWAMAAEKSTGELGKRLVAWEPLRDRCARGELGVGLIFAATGSAANHGFELGKDREHRERDSLRAQARAFEACGEFAARERLSVQRALEDV